MEKDFTYLNEVLNKYLMLTTYGTDEAGVRKVPKPEGEFYLSNSPSKTGYSFTINENQIDEICELISVVNNSMPENEKKNLLEKAEDLKVDFTLPNLYLNFVIEDRDIF